MAFLGKLAHIDIDDILENMKEISGSVNPLDMSLQDFDQNGWRKLEDPAEAAELIKNYIAKNKDKILDSGDDGKRILETMYAHMGQSLAWAGEARWTEAIEALNQSFEENNELWNSYISATIGFLEGDIKKVEDAIKTIESSKEEDKASGNLAIVKSFRKGLQAGVRDIKEVLKWPREE